MSVPEGYPSHYPPLQFDLIEELRDKTLTAIQEIGPEMFNANDIARLKSDDVWVGRFIYHQRMHMNYAFDMIMACLKWRKEFGVADLCESEYPHAYGLFDCIGAMYSFKHDKGGNRILIMHVRRYYKEPLITKLIRRYFIYYLENLEKEDPLHRISVIFDMGGASLKHVDMDFLYFMFECFKTYYPTAVESIFVFDMPWVFTAMWKVVKGWLNADAAKKIKFVNSKTILEHIDADQLLVEFGGTAVSTRTFPYDELLTKYISKH